MLKTKKVVKKIVSLMLVFAVGVGGCFTTVFAETVTTPSTPSTPVEEGTVEDGSEVVPPDDDVVTEETPEDEIVEVPSTEIAEIAQFDKSVIQQSIVAYSGKKPVLPTTISAKMTGASDYQKVPVIWKPTVAYNNKVAGTYKYEGTVTGGYTFATGVKVPQIIVKVTKCQTTIGGVATTLTKKSRTTLYDTVTVYNGYGSKLRLQGYNKKTGKWCTRKIINLKSTYKQDVKVPYVNDWWKLKSSKWRMTVDSTPGTIGVISKVTTVKTTRYYQNPSKYIQIQDKITIDNSGAYTLKSGYMGLKTRQVNRYFGIGNKYWPRYTSTTKSKVKSFQRKKGLKVTGNVDKATWLKMGYSEASWKTMGAYVSPIKVNPSSTKSQHIEAMIDRAYDYLGSDYVVGASGTPKQGADCSGLVMQALYAAGIEIPGINPVTHSWAGHEFESRNMWNNADFKKISYGNKKRGDLIFYKGPSGYVNHVAIYLGEGKVIESWPNKVRIASVGHHSIKGVMRVFN